MHKSVTEESKKWWSHCTCPYSGYATSHVFTGLNVLTQYKYRLRAINDIGTSLWSPVVTMATTSELNVLSSTQLYVMYMHTCGCQDNQNQQRTCTRLCAVEMLRWSRTFWIQSKPPPPYYFITKSITFCSYSPHYIDIPDMSGASPLMSACSLGKKEWVRKTCYMLFAIVLQLWLELWEHCWILDLILSIETQVERQGEFQ